MITNFWSIKVTGFLYRFQDYQKITQSFGKKKFLRVSLNIPFDIPYQFIFFWSKAVILNIYQGYQKKRMDFIDTKRKKLFYLLLFMEIVIFALSIAGGSLATGVFMTIMRIVLLVVSYCCVQSSWAALYSVFALISALYAFDPVGLFITGRNLQIKFRWASQDISTKHLLFNCFFF